MPKREKADRGCAPVGSFGHLLYTTRHKADLSIAEAARRAGLTGPFLVNIEKGLRAPVLAKVPMIADAYGVPPSTACWAWITTWAPAAVPHLASYDVVMATPYLQTHFHDKYVAEVAAKEAARLSVLADKRAARAAKQAQDIVGGPSPAGPDFDHVGYRLVGPWAPQEHDARGALGPTVASDAVEEKASSEVDHLK